jgi:ATP-dependent exoDNAse (exonuclease V) beta subunit
MTAPPSDQGARDAIVAERRRNVAVIAGAGTGKTKTIIDRAVALLAPGAAGDPVAIQRMALITFTRRAAGELRFRIREQLLRALEQEARLESPRAQQLREALGNLDAAFVGTIHGFADRLLRLRPVEAALSPAYTLVEDNAELVRETFWRLRRAADTGSLRSELGKHTAALDPLLVTEAAQTLRAAVRAGVQMERAEAAGSGAASLEGILARMIETRDVEVDLPAIEEPRLADAYQAATVLAQHVAKSRGQGVGHRRLRRIAYTLQRLERVTDPADAIRIIQDALAGRRLYKSHDFHNDAWGFGIYKELYPPRSTGHSLGDRLRGPHRWLATQLVRLFPVVRGMYERVKAEHEVVDYLDLLIKLRDLLRDNLDARRFYQGLLDHIFVDEFQDTDPLQCEIVFYLCENPATPPAARWEAVDLAAGKLTIVGDPQQSIYRFRRADIAMYGRAMDRLHAGGALEARLDTNFRSRPPLIAFFNQQLAKVLGKDGGPPFDPCTGRVNYEHLAAAAGTQGGGAAVHALPYADSAGTGLLAGDGRQIEAMVLARYVRWLLGCGRRVRDPGSNQERSLQPGDIAVLACTTTRLPLLLRQLDALGIPYAARGGALFLGHPVVRQYLLGLRALADRDDGVALAALLRPPFFALDWADAVAGRGNPDLAPRERLGRLQEAHAIVKALRQRRHLQAPGAVARDLLERTALARAVATGDNGRQTLAALYELATELERRAALEGLDYDAATELLRSWAESPVFLEAPEPIHTDAVRVMTMHGAKGLEFPVVIVWDGFQTFGDSGTASVWDVERDGHAWALSLGSVAVEHPAGSHLLDRERQFAEQERRRMYYVAATRARDLLVLPAPLTKSKTLRFAAADLLAGAAAELVERFATFTVEQLPLWSRFDECAPPRRITDDAALEQRLQQDRERFHAAWEVARRPLARPTAVTTAAAALPPAEEITAESARVEKASASRFGALFGTAVHRGLELVLGGAIVGGAAAVALAAQQCGLTDHLAEAQQDVERGVVALRTLGVGRDPRLTVTTEYPLVMAAAGGLLLIGFVDLLVFDSGTVHVIDFKTDAPAPGRLDAAYPTYAAQLRLYGDMLQRSGTIGTRQIRLGVLLTATGELRWA